MLIVDVLDQYENKTRYQLKPGSYTIGKGQTCDIILADELVSRVHAELNVLPESATITDNNSTNGTFINAERVDANHKLNRGDEIKIGSLSIQVDSIRGDQPVKKTRAKATKKESESVTQLKQNIHNLLLDHLDLRKRTNLHGMTADELRVEADKATREVIKEHFPDIPKEITLERLIKEVTAEAVGNYRSVGSN